MRAGLSRTGKINQNSKLNIQNFSGLFRLTACQGLQSAVFGIEQGPFFSVQGGRAVYTHEGAQGLAG